MKKVLEDWEARHVKAGNLRSQARDIEQRAQQLLEESVPYKPSDRVVLQERNSDPVQVIIVESGHVRATHLEGVGFVIQVKVNHVDSNGNPYKQNRFRRWVMLTDLQAISGQ